MPERDLVVRVANLEKNEAVTDFRLGHIERGINRGVGVGLSVLAAVVVQIVVMFLKMPG